MGASIAATHAVVAVLYQGAMPADLMKSLLDRLPGRIRNTPVIPVKWRRYILHGQGGHHCTDLFLLPGIFPVPACWPVKSALQRSARIFTPFGTVVVTSVLVLCRESRTRAWQPY